MSKTFAKHPKVTLETKILMGSASFVEEQNTAGSTVTTKISYISSIYNEVNYIDRIFSATLPDASTFPSLSYIFIYAS